MTNAGTALAAGLVSGASLVSDVLQTPDAGECVPSRIFVRRTRERPAGKGEMVGKAVAARSSVFGWCRALVTTKGTTAVRYGR